MALATLLVAEDNVGQFVTVQVCDDAVAGRERRQGGPEMGKETFLRAPIDEGSISELIGEDQIELPIPIQVANIDTTSPPAWEFASTISAESLRGAPIDEAG